MVIENFNVVRVATPPDKAKPPLVVDADAVLSDPVASQRLQMVARRLPEILQPGCRRQCTQLAARCLGQVAREALRHPVRPDRCGALIGEGSDHNALRSAYRPGGQELSPSPSAKAACRAEVRQPGCAALARATRHDG